MPRQLRPYQTEQINEIRAAVKRGNRALVCSSPTGSGKTTLASVIASLTVHANNRLFFIVDTIELIDQTVERFEADGMIVGVMQADHPKTNIAAPVQVCSIQTLRSRWTGIPESYLPDVVIIDECHVIHRQHETIIKWAKERGIVVLGLSATPYRDGLGKLFNLMIQTVTVPELIEMGFLSEFVTYAPSVPSLKGVKTQGGDYAVAELEKVMGNAAIMGDIVKHWFKYALNRQTLAFCPTRANSRALVELFKAAGVSAAHIDGETDRAERTEIIRAYRAGEIQVLCNVAVLTKGFDAPETSCVILARPTKSLALHIQICGRGLRTAAGKDHCIFLDHSGNMIRLGLPDQELPTTLDAGDIKRSESTRKEKALIPCEFCHHLTNKVVCPKCGEARQPRFFGERKEQIEAVEGELFYLPTVKAPQEPKYSDSRIRELQAMALFHGQLRGYARGWEKHFMREVTGQCVSERLAPLQPDKGALNLFKHWQIKRAKERQRNVA